MGTRGMTLGVAGSLAIAAVATWLYFTPHLAARAMKQALAERDAVRFASYVNFPALKESLKDSFTAIFMQTESAGKDYRDAVTEAAFARTVLGPVIDTMITPEGIAQLFARRGTANEGQKASIFDPDLQTQTRYESFDRFVIDIRIGKSTKEQQEPLTLVLQREGLAAWKLASIRMDKFIMNEIAGSAKPQQPDAARSPAVASPMAPAELAASNAIVREATAGELKALSGKYFDKDCDQMLDYNAEVVDLNNDGQPEVFTEVHGTCRGGMFGVYMDLYVKGSDGSWQTQFGFPGSPNVLKTTANGFPDIEVYGPGGCFPVWGWNGQKYELKQKCD